MPTLAIIDGIRILMYLNDHEPPHFHVRKAGQKAKIEIVSGCLVSGRLDRGAMKKVQSWRASNQSALLQAWTFCQKPATTR